MGLTVCDLVAGDLLEFLAAGLKDDELCPGSQGQEDRAGGHDGPVPAAATAAAAPTPASAPASSHGSGPGGLAVLGIDAEQVVVAREPEDQPVPEHGRVELDGVVLVVPEFFRLELVAL